MGKMLEDRPLGDDGRADAGGGGVADNALGDEWFDGMGDNAGEDGCGDCCSAGGLLGFRGWGR